MRQATLIASIHPCCSGGASVKTVGRMISHAILHDPHPRPVSDAAILALACADRAHGRFLNWSTEIVVGPRDQIPCRNRWNWPATNLNKTEKKVLQQPVKRQNTGYFKAPVFAVAPMIDWTDRPGK